MPIDTRQIRPALLLFFTAAIIGMLVLRAGKVTMSSVGHDRHAQALALAKLGAAARPLTRNLATFEGGNIGRIERKGFDAFDVELRSDNDDALPPFWRQWFYLKLDDVPTSTPVTITLKGAGQWHYYLPFYSYDNKTWHQFSEAQVSQPSRLTLAMKRRFTRGTVWLARYVPYTVTDLAAYLKRVGRHPDVTVGTLGRTPEGREIPMVTISADRGPRRLKSRVLIHARTHPGEVGSSFLLEGLMSHLLSNTSEARLLRERLVFDIVPMLNVDGVAKGNNRVTPRGTNLEGKWYRRADAPLELDRSKVPPEVRLLHARFKALLTDGVPVTMALNLHASGGTPEDGMFFFPHFGPASAGYAAAESALHARQLRFIDELARIHGRRWFNPPPEDGGRAFVTRSLPESWWWANFKDRVMALTVESVYGRAGTSGRWIKPDDMRELGRSLARAIARYHGIGTGAPSNLPPGATIVRTVGSAH